MVVTGMVTPDEDSPGLPREPVVVVLAIGTGDRTMRVEAVVDTGYTGYLTLPSDVAASLGLSVRGSETYELADGSLRTGPVYQGGVHMHARDLTIPIGEGEPLVGMALLSGSRLTVEAVPGGAVLIEPL